MDKKKKALTMYVLAAFGFLAVIIVFVKMFEAPVKERPKVGFLMQPFINSSNWSTTHYNGMKLAADQMGVELLVKENVPDQKEKVEEAIKEFIESGCQVVILTNSTHAALGRKLIVENPNITFYCSQTKLNYSNLYFYSGRFYEARYLAGMLAAMKSHTGRLGYVAAMPVGEVIRGINAFALGAQSVRKDAIVDVYWTGDWVRDDEERRGVHMLVDRGADVLTLHQDRSTVNELASELGVYSISYHETPPFSSPMVLANIRVQWGEIYQDVLRRAFKKPRQRDVWRGVSEDSVTCESFSKSVTSLEAERIRQARMAMLQGRKVFAGELVDTEGRVRCQQGESLSDDSIRGDMNWFVKGVVTNL